MIVQIEEVLRRSTQGRTEPFLCRGTDGEFYFVKGRGAGPRSLLAEWVAGHLGQAFGLPIADFSVVNVDPALIELGGVSGLKTDLGAGLAFGSRVRPHVQELSWPHLPMISSKTQRDVLVFDWWIRNEDRYFSQLGGNPNLLWDGDTESLLVIDHNVAFDPDFNATAFQELHVFAAQWQKVASDLAEQADYQACCDDAACDSAPAEWWWAGDDVPADFDRATIRAMLERCRGKEFWKVES